MRLITLVEKIRTLDNFPGRKRSLPKGKTREPHARVEPPKPPVDPEFQKMTKRKPAVTPVGEPPVDPKFDELLGPSS